MRSKTHGVDPALIQEGEFRWVWYKLIPTNVDITAYTVKPVNRSLRSSGSLPSGQVYAALAGIDADFSWEITGEFSFTVKAASLPALARGENLTGQEDLHALEDRYADRLESFSLEKIRTAAVDSAAAETALLSASVPGLDAAVLGAFPDIDNFTCRIHMIRYPDYTLYQSARGLYNDYIAHQEARLRADLTMSAESRIANRLRFDELAQYGELLTTYPVLLQYLSLEKDLSLLPPPASPGVSGELP
jgi:hypothetical protein